MASRKRAKGGKRKQELAEAPPPAHARGPWVIKYEASVEQVDLSEVGHAAFDIARRAIDKKLKVSPREYGTPLHHPLHGLYKLKSSHVRVAYHVQDTPPEVWILMIGDRKRIWESEQEEILARFEAELGRRVPQQRSRRK